MSTTQLCSLEPLQSFRFTDIGLSQLFRLKPELIGTVTVDQIWRRQKNKGRTIVLTSIKSLSISIDPPVAFEVTTKLTE